MEFKEVIGRRRSIRYFLPYRPVEREKIQTIMEATRLSSCAVNASFLRAIVVERDKLAPEDLEALKVPTTTLQLDMAPVHIYFYGNLNAIQESHGQTLKELFDVGALNPTHGWSHKFIEETVWPQILDPISKDPNINPIAVSMDSGVAMNQALLTAFDEGSGRAPDRVQCGKGQSHIQGAGPFHAALRHAGRLSGRILGGWRTTAAPRAGKPVF